MKSFHRILIVTDRVDYSLLHQLHWIKKTKRDTLPGTIDFYLVQDDDRKTFKKKLSKYDTVYLFCGQTFSVEYPGVLQEFDWFYGRKIHGGKASALPRYEMRQVWEKASLYQPKIFRDFSSSTLSFPFLIRGNIGHSDDSHACLAYTEKDMHEWIENHETSSYVFEEFIDTSIEGEFWDARVIKVGDTIYPEMIKWSPYWNPPHAPKHYPKYFKKGSLSLLEERTQTSLPLEMFLPYFYPFEADIAALDFSIDSHHRIVPWEIISNFALYDSECSFTDDEAYDQQRILNSILRYLDIPFSLSKYDVLAMIEEMVSVPNGYHEGHIYKDWEKWKPYHQQ